MRTAATSSAAYQGYRRALDLHQRIGDRRGIAADYNNLGLLAQETGDLKIARHHLDSALALNRADGRDEIAATNLVNLAGLAALSGEFGEAEAYYREALAIWQDQELWSDAASALDGLGTLEMRRGDYPAAKAALRKALSLYEQTGQVAERLEVQRALAGSLAATGDLQGGPRSASAGGAARRLGQGIGRSTGRLGPGKSRPRHRAERSSGGRAFLPPCRGPVSRGPLACRNSRGASGPGLTASRPGRSRRGWRVAPIRLAVSADCRAPALGSTHPDSAGETLSATG